VSNHAGALFTLGLGPSAASDRRGKLVAVRNRADGVAVLVRVLQEDGTEAVYFEFPLARRDDGSAGYADVILHIAGFRLAQMIQSVDAPLQWLGGDLTPEEGARLRLACDEAEMKITLLGNGGRVADALETYDAQPERVRANLDVLTTLANVVEARGDDEQLAAAIERFRRHRPDDPSLTAYELSLANRKEDWESILALVRKLDERIGGDAWMTSWEGQVLTQLGRYEEAREKFRAAAASEPELESVLWDRLDLEVAAEQWGAVVEQLDRIEARIGQLDPDTLVEVYPALGARREFAEWRKSRGG